jgi:hypothetical protein
VVAETSGLDRIIAKEPNVVALRRGRRDLGDQDEIAQNAERLWRVGNRCHRGQDETKSDADRGDDVERAGSDGVSSDPDEARGHADGDSADGQDKEGHDKG